MMNTKILSEFQGKKSKILAVTKYFDPEQTVSFMKACEAFDDVIIGFGENRVRAIQEKKIERSKLHFIGNIQSRNIGDIVASCSVVHSVGSRKHLEKIIKYSQELQKNTALFLQLNLDREKQNGFSHEDLIQILQNIEDHEYCKIMGISGMGKSDFEKHEKIEEFQKLLDLRDSYLPDGKISAGTSRDYEIALEMGIEIIRIGKKLFD